jgi:hypothetical protein
MGDQAAGSVHDGVDLIDWLIARLNTQLWMPPRADWVSLGDPAAVSRGAFGQYLFRLAVPTK